MNKVTIRFDGMARVSGYYSIDIDAMYVKWLREFDLADPDQGRRACDYEAFCNWLAQYLENYEYGEIDDVDDPDNAEIDWDRFPISDDQFIEGIWDELIVKPTRNCKGQESLFSGVDLSAI